MTTIRTRKYMTVRMIKLLFHVHLFLFSLLSFIKITKKNLNKKKYRSSPYTSSPADKKYGSTLPTNKKSETSDTNI